MKKYIIAAAVVLTTGVITTMNTSNTAKTVKNDKTTIAYSSKAILATAD